MIDSGILFFGPMDKIIDFFENAFHNLASTHMAFHKQQIDLFERNRKTASLYAMMDRAIKAFSTSLFGLYFVLDIITERYSDITFLPEIISRDIRIQEFMIHNYHVTLSEFDSKLQNIAASIIQKQWRLVMTKKHKAVRKIQHSWRLVVCNPTFKICRDRLLFEFSKMENEV